MSETPVVPATPTHAGPTYATTKWTSAGGVVLKGLSRQAIDYVWVIKPSGSYGSSWSLPKGRKDEGSTLEETATREVLEESGLMAKFIPNGYLGSHEGSSSTTHYYLMVQTTGNPLDHDFETEKVLLLKIDDAIALMEKDYNRRDERVLKLAKEKIDLLKSNLGY